ncbi:TadE/TadG family type IV pilus assembly protein [Sphingomonas xanthus]|nr:TadE/TadG family type IV pilus assembly protein [Sphingomonas xanthus]
MLTCRSGAAAAEMALVLPILITILFGSVELGRYFMDSHVVAKAVRDGARFAGRQPFTEMPCGGTATKESDIKNLVRTGTTANGAPARISYWTNPATITVTITCDSTAAYTSSGIYANASGGARRVTIVAAVPYATLFGFSASGLNVPGRSEAAVMGI